MKVYSGNAEYATPEFMDKLEQFAKRVDAVEKKRKELYEEIQKLEDESWELNIHCFDSEHLYYINRSEYDVRQAHIEWLASDHNC